MKKRKVIKNTYTLFIPFNSFFIPLSFLIPFVVYLYTLCPTVSTYADAGEFPTMAYISGFAHPPGYPLFILLVKLFQLLPFGNPAQMANLVSAFFGASAILIFFLLTKLLTKNNFASFTAGQILAFSAIYWKNSVVSEVFSLLAFFIVLAILFYLLWIKTKKKNYFYAFLVTSGFGLAHHQLLIITLLPLLLVFIFKKQWNFITFKVFFKGIIFFLLGFLPFVYVLIAARHTPLMNWEDPHTLYGLFRLITRASYGTFTLTDISRQAPIPQQALGILKMLQESFSAPAIFLALIGTAYGLIKYRAITIYSLFVIIAIFIFMLFSGMPVNQPIQIQYLERFAVISSIFITLMIGFCLLLITQSVRRIIYASWKFASHLISKPNIQIVNLFVFFLILLMPIYLLIANFSKTSQRNNYFGEYMADDFLLSVPPNSIFFLEGDSQINSIFYNRYVQNKRPDIIYIVGGMLNGQPDWYIKELKSFYPNLIYPDSKLSSDTYFSQFIRLNSAKRDIFASDTETDSRLRLEIPKIKIGLTWKYFPSDQESGLSEIEKINVKYIKNLKNLKGFRKYPQGWPEYTLLTNYTETYIFLAEINDQDIKKSEKYYSEAIKIIPDNYIPYLELGDDYDMHGNKTKAVEYWKQAIKHLGTDKEDIKNDIEDKIFRNQ